MVLILCPDRRDAKVNSPFSSYRSLQIYHNSDIDETECPGLSRLPGMKSTLVWLQQIVAGSKIGFIC